MARCVLGRRNMQKISQIAMLREIAHLVNATLFNGVDRKAEATAMTTATIRARIILIFVT